MHPNVIWKGQDGWELVRACRDILKENYSDWQERKANEEERKKLQDIEEKSREGWKGKMTSRPSLKSRK